VQKAVRRLCRRQQLSVFACRGTPARVSRLEKELLRLMDPAEDRLLVLDVGPADTAAARLKAMNSMSEIPELKGFLT
jgi:CRISPR-associated protein Cas2